MLFTYRLCNFKADPYLVISVVICAFDFGVGEKWYDVFAAVVFEFLCCLFLLLKFATVISVVLFWIGMNSLLFWLEDFA